MLADHLGRARTLSMLLTAQLMDTDEAAACGFVTQLERADLELALDRLLNRLAGNAPLSMWAAKEAVHRLRIRNLPDGDDIVRRVFGSSDFNTGVQAFRSKEKPQWQGR